MKRLISGLFLLAFVAVGHSQIVLEEAKITSDPTSMKVDPVKNVYVLTIPEKSFGEFEKDPLAFVRANLDVKKFLADNEEGRFSWVEVTFKSRKGKLLAQHDDEGELISTHMKLKDVALPDEVRMAILEKNRNVKFLGSNHIVTSKGWDINKDVYRVNIFDGDRKKNVKVAKNAMGYAVAVL